jgi:hypothetical protein
MDRHELDLGEVRMRLVVTDMQGESNQEGPDHDAPLPQ